MDKLRLINQLKEEHKIILNLLNEVINIGIGSKEGQKKLLLVKSQLLSHLKKEDNDLYPLLRKLAETDKLINSTLNTFALDMDKISNQALDFFEKYENGGNGLEFAKDFGNLFSKLSFRIRREENILYELLLKS